MKNLLRPKNLNFFVHNVNKVEYSAPGLSISPAQIQDYTNKGLPVSSYQVSGNFYDGDTNDDMYLSPEFIRGIDANDILEISKNAAKNIRKTKNK